MANLDGERYLALETLRKDGTAVATPVWFARLDDDYFVFSAGDAGKVKRLRRSDAARVAACDMRGKRTGPWHDTHAYLADNDAGVSSRAYAALREKYGWQMWLADLFSRLGGKIDERQLIRISRPV